jgi:nitrogenase molybdenum-iron protein alpha/beta subunit
MLEGYQRRRNHPYMHGVYMATNAVSDAILLVDGPNCSFFKTEHLFGAHDWRSTLLDAGGRQRIVNTDLHPDKVIVGHDERFSATLARLVDASDAGAVLACALPMAALTGIEYDRLIDQVVEDAAEPCPVVPVPARSLSRDWLHGYAAVLQAIAKEIDLPAPDPAPTRVAVVGHLMDRLEDDQRANVEELKRLMRGVGLELVSVWLDGGRYEELAQIARAGLIVSLPYGRQAARTLARRLDLPLVEAALPFGPDATRRMLMAVAEAADRRPEAEHFIAAEQRELMLRWEWLVPKRTMHREIGFMGDPHHMAGLCELASLLGMSVRLLVAYAAELPDLAAPEPEGWPAEIHWEPRDSSVISDALMKPTGGRAIDLLIGNFHALHHVHGLGLHMDEHTRAKIGGLPRTLEFGFPSRGYHALYDAPFLGFMGARAFAARVADVLGDRGVYQ